MSLFSKISAMLLCTLLYPVFYFHAAPPNRAVFSEDPLLSPSDEFRSVYEPLSGSRYTRGRFKQTKTIPSLNRSLVSEGLFTISADEGIIWNTVAPFPSVLVVGTDYLIQSAGGSVSKIDAAGNRAFMEMSEAFRSVFTGNTDVLFSKFKVFFRYTEDEWTVGLVPLDSMLSSFIRSIIIGGSRFISYVVMEEGGGGSISYELSCQELSDTATAEEGRLFALQ